MSELSSQLAALEEVIEQVRGRCDELSQGIADCRVSGTFDPILREMAEYLPTVLSAAVEGLEAVDRLETSHAVVKLGAVLVRACAGLPDDHRLAEDLPVADVLREMAAAAVREVRHHKRLLAVVTTERDQLQEAAQKLVAAAAACDAEAERHPSSRSSAPMVRYIGALERYRDVRAVF